MAITPDTTGNTPVTTGATSASVDITAAAVGAWVYLWCAISTATTSQSGVPSNASWTTLQSTQTNAGTSGATYALYRRQKQSGDTTFSFSWTTSAKGVFVWQSYTGLDPNTPDEASAITQNDTTSRSAIPTPLATPTAANRWALACFGVRTTTAANKSIDWTPDAATAERADVNNSGAASAAWMGTEIADTNSAVTQASQSYTATHNVTGTPTNESHDGSAILFLIPAAQAGGQEYLPPVNPPGLTTPAAWSDIPGPVPVSGLTDPSWKGPAPFPPGAEAQPPLNPPGLTTPAAWSDMPSPSASQFNAMADWSVPSVSGLPQFIDQPGSRPRWAPRIPRGVFQNPGWGQGNQGTQFPLLLRQRAVSPRTITVVRPSRGQFFNQAWGQGNQGTQFPLYLRQAGSASRWTLRRSHGTFFQQSWGQANQGTQFPLFMRQAGNASRWTLRRTQGRFFNPGQFNLDGNPWPSFTRQAGTASRWTLRRSHGTFFNQAWGQGNQGAQFPLYLQQAQRKRLTLRRSEGNFFSPGQFNLAAPQLPNFTRQAGLSRLTLRRSQGRFFNQAWGQANQGVSFPLWMRQAQSGRLTVRYPRGQFFMQAWGQVQAPPAIISGAEQYPQITPPFTSPASWWQPWVPPADPSFSPPPAVAAFAPPFAGRQQRPVPARIPRGKFSLPGQFNLDGNPYPSFTRQPQLQRLGLRRSQGRFFSPGQFNLTATRVPQFLSPRRPKLSPARRGQFRGIPVTAVIPAYPPDFRTTRRVLFTRLDGIRHNRIIQLVPFRASATGSPLFRLGQPRFQWDTEIPAFQWATGTPRT